MDYYSDVCDKTIEIKSESKHLRILTHNQFEKCLRIKRALSKIPISLT